MKISPQFIVDDRGQRRGVLLTIEEYRRLLEFVEDQLDAADLDAAVAADDQLVAYDQVRADLRAEGLL